MTGIECLRAEIVKRGLTRQQAESKVVPVVLDILTDSGAQWQDAAKLANDISALRREKEELELKINRLQRDVEYIAGRKVQEQREKYLDAPEYIKQFMEVLNSLETPEERDTLKRAQMFVNTVSVETKYDNTAFIIGLASILSSGGTGAIDELRKINPKIPNPFYRGVTII